jgi:formamidopyrimidine-DNA glycosylase
MPELPEVEHARRRLLSALGGEPIVEAASLDPIVVPQEASRFRAGLVGRRAAGADRVGKNVLLHLEGGSALWFHLGMTGHVVVEKRGAKELPRFTRWWIATPEVRICLADGRRLGRALAGPEEEVRERSGIPKLGPDALGLDAEVLAARLAKVRGPIKAALMDQARLAGIGNIQAAEALWRAKIHPETPVPALDARAWSALAKAIRTSLDESLASMRPDEDVVYVEQGGPNPFRVYDREGEKCPRCRKAKIVREVARGRASYLCPHCQPKAKARTKQRRAKRRASNTMRA